MKIRITSVDFAPDELYDQTPFDADLLREFPGPDRSDYWIGALTNPIRWVRNSVETFVSYVVLASRYEGTRISAGMKSFIVGIAYVVDESMLEDPALTFEKCEYVAIGSTDDISDAA